MNTRTSSIHKEIFKLSVPNVLSNISVPLISSVDTALMGYLSVQYLGAVGLGAMIFNFIYWNFGFLRMGTTGMTAQSFGRNSEKEIVNTLGRGLLVALIISLILLAIQGPFASICIHLLGVESDMVPLVTKYFLIRIWAAPATLGLYVLMGWFFGMQNAVYPLILTIAINISNIVLSFYFVRTLNWDISGVAWGTVIAQYCGLLLGFLLLLIKYRQYFGSLYLAALLQLGEFKKFLKINGDIFLRTVFLTLAFGFFYRQSAVFGETILAVNVVLLQFLNWMSYGIDGFAFASESLVGKYYGAKNDTMLKASIKWSMIWALILALIISIFYWLLGDQIFLMFTPDVDILEAAKPFLLWMIFMPLFGTPSYIWDGIYIGLTASRAMRNTMAVAFIIYLLVYYIFEPILGNHGLWLALLSFLIARGLLQWYLYYWKGDKLN